jgi:hypothetical protein
MLDPARTRPKFSLRLAWTDFEERFGRLEKHLETVAKEIDVLARGTEREFRDLHHSINHRFERVSARLEAIEARIEFFHAAWMTRSNSATNSPTASPPWAVCLSEPKIKNGKTPTWGVIPFL